MAVRGSICVEAIPDLPAVPHQPSGFVFPKRPFGKARVVFRSFQGSWFKEWPFLHYDEAKDAAFCHTCATALKVKKIRASNVESSFISQGFSNWKDATRVLKNHVLSSCHREAVEAMITLPATTRDIGEQLSQQHSKEKQINRKMLLKIVSSLRYLARQGLAIRGDGSEKDCNLAQLLRLKGEDDSLMLDWLERRYNKYTSPEIQNELLSVMGRLVIQDVSANLQQSPYLTIMLDETTDVRNHEQAVIVLRRVTDDLQVFEELLGLYHVPSIGSEILTKVAKDVLCHFNLPITKLRGQCYDGASAMRGIRTGVAKQICDEEPRALYTHCYGHSINLAVNDAIKLSKQLKMALEVTHEITKLIKYSPRREEIFKSLKSVHDHTTQHISPGIRVLCPTRWTVNADALTSILENYQVLQTTWDQATEVSTDTEIKARILGVSTQMGKFDFLFGVVLGQLILGHSDNLSKSLEKKTCSAAEGQEVAHMVIKTLQGIRTEQSFDLFWTKLAKLSETLDVDEAQLPRRRKVPSRYDDGLASCHFHDTPKVYYRQLYYEAVDNSIQCLNNRFDQPGYHIYSNLEQLLIKAAMKENYELHFKTVCDFYKDDIKPEVLQVQLVTFGANFPNNPGKKRPTVFDIRDYMTAMTQAQRDLLDQVVNIMKLILEMPATNSTSERSFSALHRVKTYLRSTMGQQRLNDLLLLHVHKEITDSLNLKEVVNNFVNRGHRLQVFGKFSDL